jgi:hypothetical protein
MRTAIAVVLFSILLLPFATVAHGSGSAGRRAWRPTAIKRSQVTRDKLREKYHRSAAARRAFLQQHPCPSTGKPSGPCPGYVVDHVKPLKRGGADTSGNMQWQTKEAAKAKDRWE